MKRRLSCILFMCVPVLVGALAAQNTPATTSPVHVATALNHLTVLEFHEAVTMAAAGSSDFQIERQEDKVFVKPMKPGAATDLFVWTVSDRFFAYELETTPEVKDMSFALNNPLPQSTSAVSATGDSHVEEFADLMLTRAFLGTAEISPAKPHAEKKGQVIVRIEQVFRTKTTVYVQYAVENRTKHPYHIPQPSACEIQPGRSTLSLPSFSHKQLDNRQLASLHQAQDIALPIAHAETAAEDISPGEFTHGVIAIRQDLQSPAVVQLQFAGKITATFVL
jgi:hypothetical protein